MYKDEYLELDHLHRGWERDETMTASCIHLAMCTHVQLRLARPGVPLELVQRMYLAWRVLVVNHLSFEIQVTDQEILDTEHTDRWMVSVCCCQAPTGDSEHDAHEPRMNMDRLTALCQLNVLAHILLFQNSPDNDGIALVKWMHAQLGRPTTLPCFEFRLHALYIVHCVDDVAMETDIRNMCGNRDMTALQLFAHDLIRWIRTKGILDIPSRVSREEVLDIVCRVYGAHIGLKALDYETMTRTPVYTQQPQTTFASTISEGQWYDIVTQFGQSYTPPGAPSRKRTRRNVTLRDARTTLARR